MCTTNPRILVVIWVIFRLRRLCSEDSGFSLKPEQMCDSFDKRGYPASDVQAGHHRAQQIDRQSMLQRSQKDLTVTLTLKEARKDTRL